MAVKLGDLPSHRQMVKNILYIWATASPDDMAEGMNWYADAYQECGSIAIQNDVPLHTVAKLVSVISPSIMWGGCLSAPEKIIDLWQRGVPASEWQGFNIYPHNLVKAESILNGDHSVLKGNKVNAFYLNIMGHDYPVTVDRWAIRVVFDDPFLPKEMIIPSGKKVYNAIADAYRSAATILDQKPCDVQAVTWTVFRNAYNGRVRAQKRRAAQRVQQEALIPA